MESHASEPSAVTELQQQIDNCCGDFEQAWRDGNTPSLEEFLLRVSPTARAQLLRELLIIEVQHRRGANGVEISDDELCELHRELMPGIATHLKLLRDRKWGLSGDHDVTQRPRSSTRDAEPTIDLQRSTSSGSRGLHIRCPHCSNPVELLADTPLESITCSTCGSAFSLVDNQEQTEQSPALKQIGRFELVARLGMGSFGTVWKARDTELDRTVALKLPRKGQLAPDEVEQFFREARSAAQLRHPNIVPVHEVGREDDTIFIVSDFIRGVSLADWLTGADPNLHEIARLLATIADALQHAHERGVIHRDLKPPNILLDESGQPHIMDFGLAKRDVGEISMTMDGHVLGTPAYMSPEQARGHSHWTDGRTDIYSLGVILFRMLTGELPFRGNAQMQIHQRLTQDPPDPRSLNRYLPRDLCTICLKCLERDANRRFSSAKELSEELRRYDRGEPILSRPISRTERLLRWGKRNRALTAALLLTAILAIAGPIAAAVFRTQRNRLDALVVERNNVLQQMTKEKEADANRIDELSSALDLWEGRADPWQLWPPEPSEPARKALLEIVAGQGPEVVNAEPFESDPARQVHLHLAVAIMNDELDRTDKAIESYRQAEKLLAKLAADSPAATQYAAALADCYRQLSRLEIPTDRVAAAQDLEQGRTIYARLANDHIDPRLHAEWLETELDAAIVGGAEAGMQSIRRADEIKQRFPRLVLNDPVKLYELACFLGHREPIMITRKSSKPSD